jgi:hypothetical protein
MKSTSSRDLEVWKKAVDLAKIIYEDCSGKITKFLSLWQKSYSIAKSRLLTCPLPLEGGGLGWGWRK